MTIPPCNEIAPGWCRVHSRQLETACRDFDKPVGAKILVKLDGRVCFCVCGGDHVPPLEDEPPDDAIHEIDADWLRAELADWLGVAEPLPRTFVLAARAATAAMRWSASGFALVDETTRARRLSACQTCPHLADPPRKGAHRVTNALRPDAKLCGLCGCVTGMKARLASASCPGVDPADPARTRWGEPRELDAPAGTRRERVPAAG
jgi:hypothetical protein